MTFWPTWIAIAVFTCTMAFLLSACAYDRPFIAAGEPAVYVCLQHSPSGVCLRSQWRCPMPTQLMSQWGRPRCVMPGDAAR